jgi:hypothetical protein
MLIADPSTTQAVSGPLREDPGFEDLATSNLRLLGRD